MTGCAQDFPALAGQGVGEIAGGQLDDHLRKVIGQQRPGCPLGNDAAMINDDYFVTEPVRLFHVVRGQHNGLSLGTNALNQVPEIAPRLRIQPGGRFIKKQDLGIIDHGYREQQPLPLATGKPSGILMTELLQRAEPAQTVDGQTATVKTSKEAEILFNRQEFLQCRGLKLHAGPFAELGVQRSALVKDGAGCGRKYALHDLDRRCLARAVRPQQTEAGTLRHAEADAINSAHFRVMFDEIDDLHRVCGFGRDAGKSGRHYTQRSPGGHAVASAHPHGLTCRADRLDCRPRFPDFGHHMPIRSFAICLLLLTPLFLSACDRSSQDDTAPAGNVEQNTAVETGGTATVSSSPLPPPAATPATMTRVVYRFAGDNIPQDSHLARPRKLWRAGDTHLRLELSRGEEAPLVYITHSPNSWTWNRAEGTLKHEVDPGPTYAVILRAFSPPPAPELAALQLGKEAEFFASRDATSGPDSEIDGIPVSSQIVEIPPHTVTLYRHRSEGRPVQLSLKTPNAEYHVRYDLYEVELPTDAALFAPPPGVSLSSG